MGPCRLNARDPYSKVGVCGATIDTAPFPGQSGAFNVPGSGIDNLAQYDAEQLLSFYNFQPNVHPDISGKNWTVDEEMTTYYAQLNIDTDVGDMPLRGNEALAEPEVRAPAYRIP